MLAVQLVNLGYNGNSRNGSVGLHLSDIQQGLCVFPVSALLTLKWCGRRSNIINKLTYVPQKFRKVLWSLLPYPPNMSTWRLNFSTCCCRRLFVFSSILHFTSQGSPYQTRLAGDSSPTLTKLSETWCQNCSYKYLTVMVLASVD